MRGSRSRIASLTKITFGAAILLNAGIAFAQVSSGSEDPNNWPQYHRTSNGWRYSPLDEINKDNLRT